MPRRWNQDWKATPPVQEWSPIPGYDEYLIGSRGWVWSTRLNRCLASHEQARGFDRVHLNVDGEQITRPLHELAHEAFAGPYPFPGSDLNELTAEAERAERWLPIVGMEGKYLVSDMGRIWTLSRKRLLTPVVTPLGYAVVCLSRPPSRTTRKVHRILLEAFVGFAPKGTEARHLDGDRLNNQLSNLTWGTKLENADDIRRHGTNPFRNRDACKWGHKFVEANLIVRRAERRHTRTCRSCRWGQYTARTSDGLYDPRMLADLMYAHLADGGPDPRTQSDILEAARVAA